MKVIQSKDWYAIGNIFVNPFYFDDPLSGTPSAKKFGVNIGIQVLTAMDVGASFALHARPVEKTPNFYTAEEILNFLKEVFSLHGKPRIGVVVSHSVWQSSQEMLLDPDTNDRGEFLKNLDVDIPPMPEVEKEKLSRAISQLGLRIEFDGDKIME